MSVNAANSDPATTQIEVDTSVRPLPLVLQPPEGLPLSIMRNEVLKAADPTYDPLINVGKQPLTPGSISGSLSSAIAVDAWQDTSLEASTMMSDSIWQDSANEVDRSNDNFAAWLFDTPGSQSHAFSLNLPFFEYGTQTSPGTWDYDQFIIGTGDAETQNMAFLDSGIYPHCAPLPAVDHATNISERRREEIASVVCSFARKKANAVPETHLGDEADVLYGITSNLPNLSVSLLGSLMHAFWVHAAQHMPIVHRSTFSCEQCNSLQLLSMLSLGAVHTRGSPGNNDQSVRRFADLVMTNLRWEVLVDDDAQPPAQLWVAQTLLLLELYEKMFGPRRLHERAHIHHASTLTLLRRGSPMVGRSGSQTPRSCTSTRCGSPAHGNDAPRYWEPSVAMRWWRRWVESESMHRVVFSAFQMDALHAVMFGHESALLPYEIRLPLPCDDALWSATSPEEVQRLESSFSMHGIKPVSFLDGLKRSLHGQDVPCHHNGRLALMAGLMSVGHQMDRREKNLQFLENLPPGQEQDRWKTVLAKAYEQWRRSFDEALSTANARKGCAGRSLGGQGDPAVLYHLANITMHIDVVDLQIAAGTKRLLGRRIHEKDHGGVTRRLRTWASTSIARTAAMHAVKLLHETLVPVHPADGLNVEQVAAGYSCRCDSSLYRPWALYIAALTVWAYQSLSTRHSVPCQHAPSLSHDSAGSVAARCLSICANITNADRLPLTLTMEGCAAILHLLSEDFANSKWELLVEASKLLRSCEKAFTT